jgi:DNA-binding MarR family transcriptional regulator
MLIAIRSGLSLKHTASALKSLTSLGIAASKDGRSWHLTRRGIGSAASADAPPRKRGRKPGDATKPSPSAQRLLACLDRPRTSAELSALMNVTRQRIHQILVVLFALDLIRSADPEHPTGLVARKEDASVLLRRDQERVLSAFPQSGATTRSRLATAAGLRAAAIAAALEFLSREGLIETTGTTRSGDLYQLTPAGSAHWQRSATANRADLPPPPFRSDRVRDVLTYLEEHGQRRTRDIAAELNIPPTSMNALMQYLKRRNAVGNRNDVRHSPYGLTADGRRMLAAMRDARPL